MRLLLFLSTIALVCCQTCDTIRGNCTECLQTSGCVYCSSPVASGCFSSALSSYCSALQGTLNNCSVSGTPCVQHSNCNTCQSDSRCHWCDTPIGYCFDATNGGLVCSNLQGKWNPTSCASTPQPNTTNTNTSNVNLVDPQASCQDFRGTQCIGTIFYNVYVNATDSQEQMSVAASSIAAMAGLPGVSPDCRSFATLYNCGNIFKRCEQIPQTTVSVSVPPCRSLCEGFRDSCANVLATVGVTITCDQLPVDQVQYLYNNKIYNFTCNNMIPSTDDNGWFPNKLTNSDFTQISSDNSSLIGWESSQEYTIIQDLVFDSEKTVIEVVADTVISQTVIFNQDVAAPIRISAYSKAINVFGYGNYSICVDLIYGDFDSELICGEFLNGTHDYELLQVVANPKTAIENATFIINFTKPGISYFYRVSLQEQIPATPSNPFNCFEPLEYDADWEAKGTSPCALPCPYDEVWDDSSVLDSVKSMYVALSWIGIFLNMFLILTWTIFPEKRKYPERFVLYFSCCVMLVSISGVAQTGYTRQEIACYDHFTFANQSNSPYCGFLAVFLQIGASGGLAWWMSICISTWLMIRYHLKQRAWRNTEKYFHMGVWTYVGLSTIVPLAASHMGYWVGAVGCWIDLAYHSAFQFACFYVPEAICMVVSVILVADSTRIIRNVQKQSSDLKTTKKKGPRFTYEFRSVGFITIIFFNVLFLFAFKFHTFSRQDAYEKSIQDEVLCRSQGGTYEECRKGTYLSAVAFWFNCFGIVIESIICFIFFGIREKHLILWRNLVFAKIAPRFVKPLSTSHESSASLPHTGPTPRYSIVTSTSTNSIQMAKLSSTSTTEEL